MLTLVHDGPPGAGQALQTPTDPIARVLGQTFVAACETFSAPNEARLRETVFLFVTRLKAKNVPPERVLVATKSAISSCGDGRPPSLAESLSGSANPTRHRTYSRVFQWILEAYFG